VTLQQQELQALITEIDAILGKNHSRLSRAAAKEIDHHRQLFTRVKEHLVEPQIEPPPTLDSPTLPAIAEEPSLAASQVLKALLEEMQYLRGQTLQILTPLQTEVSSLRQQREALLSEVQELQQQRLAQAASSDPDQLPRPWQQALNRLTDHLDSYLTDRLDGAVKRLEASTANSYLLSQSPQEGITLDQQPGLLSPEQRLHYLQQVQTETDQLVRNLDLSLRTVFETLHQTLYGYQDSLHQGLHQMHSLGQQGEALFTTLVNHLSQGFTPNPRAAQKIAAVGPSRQPEPALSAPTPLPVIPTFTPPAVLPPYPAPLNRWIGIACKEAWRRT
jgi:hypothetical protein